MRRLFANPEPDELDPETQAIVDAVCLAVEGFDGSMAQTAAIRDRNFGQDLMITVINTDSEECRREVFAAADALVRLSGEFLGTDGRIYPRHQIATHEGRLRSITTMTGELRRVLEWPADYYADGTPFYDEMRTNEHAT